MALIGLRLDGSTETARIGPSQKLVPPAVFRLVMSATCCIAELPYADALSKRRISRSGGTSTSEKLLIATSLWLDADFLVLMQRISGLDNKNEALP